MNQEILTAAANGAEIITPTQRLSKHLQHHYAVQNVQQDRSVWHSPDILTWTSWCEREWQSLSLVLSHPALLLNDVQRQWIWQYIIQSSDLSVYCLSNSSTARLAAQSYSTIRAACIPIDWKGGDLNDNTSAFKAWRLAYQRYLEEHHLIDSADLPDVLPQYIQPVKNRHIVFYGFDIFTPQQRRLMQALQSAGIVVHKMGPRRQNKKKTTLQFADIHSEIRHIACWARQQLNRDPDTTIGIISLDLDARRAQLQSELDLILHPQLLLGCGAHGQRAYSLSLGRALQHYPLIYVAMQLLALADKKIPLSRISTILLSPYLAGAQEERDQRALLDAYLRRYGEQQLTLKTLFRIVETQCGTDQQCPIFIERLKDFAHLFLTAPRQQSFYYWSKTFNEWLIALGWLHQYPLGSSEYQVINAWQQVLQQLSSLAQVGHRVSYAAAFSQLLYMVNTQRFQIETAETPIQVIGINSAAAMQFDYIWMLGMHDRVWPPPANPDPFIPFALQVQAGVSAATSQGQYHLAHQVSANIAQASKEAIFSYPLQQGDQLLRASPLIPVQGKIADIISDEVNDDYRRRLFRSQRLEYFFDDHGPAVAVAEKVSGGAALFKDQAICPFRSFAKHRLDANGLHPQHVGLDRAARGILVHALLQRLWQQLQTLGGLQQSAEIGLDQLICSTVSALIDRQIVLQPETFTARFARLEQQRLIALVSEWLMLEKRRTAFTVLATERCHHITFAGIKISIRVDRVDRLADGSLAIIDYKTGMISVNAWEEEPQLPLYVVTQQDRVAAALFAKVKRGEMQFVGLTDGPLQFPDMKCIPMADNWSDTVDQWHAMLSRLATKFRSGEAQVAPRNRQACQYCDLHTLCRVYQHNDTVS